VSGRSKYHVRSDDSGRSAACSTLWPKRSARIPTSEWQFFHKAVNAQLTFEPGGDGHAVRLVLHQNGSDQVAERI
jgi:hypothetical protein